MLAMTHVLLETKQAAKVATDTTPFIQTSLVNEMTWTDSPARAHFECSNSFLAIG
jgi:hypothetical protein